jgi:hypothetical protein
VKTRTGFVSNSSTSSFLIYGIMLSDKDLYEWELPKGLKQYTRYDDSCAYLGASPVSGADDETFRQFKTRVEASVRACCADNNSPLPEDAAFRWQEDAWYDG